MARERPLTESERLDWLRLIRSENVGPIGIMAQTPQEQALCLLFTQMSC
jgi:hypothetical protein